MLRRPFHLFLMTALLLRAVIPVGFMPGSLAEGRGIMLCGGDPYSRALASISISSCTAHAYASPRGDVGAPRHTIRAPRIPRRV